MGFIAYSSPLEALTDDIMIDGSTPPTLTEKDYLGINFSTIPDVEMIQVQIDSDRFIEFLDKRGNFFESYNSII